MPDLLRSGGAVLAVVASTCGLGGTAAMARPLGGGPPPTAADLAARGCVDDFTGREDCAVSAEGLTGATDLAVSPEGDSVYVTSGLGDHAVVAFERNPATGGLRPLGCVDDVDVGTAACEQTTVGLHGAAGIAVSPDGNSVYAVGSTDNAIVRFDREPSTGVLTPRDCISDPDPSADTPPASCPQATDGLDNPIGVAVSPDGLAVFATSLNDSAVVRFNRDPATGALTPAGCIDDPTTGRDSCGASTDGLSGAWGTALAVDPRGESIYVAGLTDDSVVGLSAGAGTSEFFPLGCIQDNDTGTGPCDQSANGLDLVYDLAVSPEGNSVYAASAFDSAVVGFSRDASTGTLTPAGCVQGRASLESCERTAPGLVGQNGVVVTPDGRSVFTTSRGGIIAGFERAPGTGALTSAGCIEDDGMDVEGVCPLSAPALDDAMDLAVSPVGTSLYVTSHTDQAVQIFGLNPPDTSLTVGPPRSTDDRKVTFKFRSEEAGARFACALDGRAAKACESPLKIRARPGRHVLEVVATDPDGNVDPTPDVYRWRVTRN